MNKVLLVLILLVTVDTAFACRCVPLTFEQESTSANRIFRGRVVSVDHYTFDVELIKVWKGEFETNTFQLKQGKNSCERRTFGLNKEYLFYVSGESVFNCSRTDEYQLTMDSELLDLKFKNIGDRESIESNSITEKENAILKSLLKSKNKHDEIGDKQVFFAIQDKWVDKWAFFNSCRWADIEIKLIKPGKEKSSGATILWIGNNWDKSLRKLKKSM
ncbi:MAG: hypothetical protein HYZ44_17910 [Bacteroidetes bacterium]|nr:hypothetical protein [Bacteroidota bacterium]